jgi:hypothetical protein
MPLILLFFTIVIEKISSINRFIDRLKKIIYSRKNFMNIYKRLKNTAIRTKTLLNLTDRQIGLSRDFNSSYDICI